LLRHNGVDKGREDDNVSDPLKELLEGFKAERDTYRQLIKRQEAMDALNFDEPIRNSVKETLRLTKEALAHVEEAITLAEKK